MKVIIVIDYWFPGIGGGPIHVAEIAKELLRKKNLKLTIISSNLFLDNLKGKIPDKYAELPVVRLGKKLPYTSLWGRINFLWHLFFYLLQQNFDLIHVHPFTPLILAKAVAVIKRKPIVLTVHTLGYEMFGFGKGNTKLVFYFLRIISKFLIFSVPYSAQIFVDKNLMKQMNINRSRYFIPNGVDLSAFTNLKVKKASGFQLLFVGRFHPQKNLASLIYAFSHVAREFTHARLQLVGSGEEEKMLKSMAKNLGLTDKVRFQSPFFGDNLIRIYKESHLFVLPSRYEGFPLSILEAWAAKIPLAATRVGMIPNLVKDGVNGFIIKSPSVDDILQTLKRAILLKKLDQLAENGYQLAAKFSWARTAEKTYRLYKRLVQY